MKFCDQGLNRAGAAVCCALTCAITFVSCGPTPEPEEGGVSIEAVIEYSPESDALVLSFRQTGGLIHSLDAPPLLRIYGDGRTLIHLPDASPKAGDYLLQLTDEEMTNLLESLSLKGVMTFDADVIKREIGNAIRARSGPRAGAVVSDDVTTHIELQLERYRPAGSSQAPTTEFRQTVSWYALGADARRYPEVESLQALAAAERELIRLSARDDLRPTEP